MSDSVDRVFVHALNTVKKIPRTGSARPPPSDRLKLYGLYKQSMEGDVEGVMRRPEGERPDEDAEKEKWDAWSAQHGLSRTEAKRRYISTLIETMHQYASATSEARELVAELEFVWDQIKSNSISSSGSSPPQTLGLSQQQPPSYASIGPGRATEAEGGGLRVMRPVSEGDMEEEEEGEEFEEVRDTRHMDDNEAVTRGDGEERRIDYDVRNRKWRKRIEQALVKMTTELAALREQTEEKRFFDGRRHKGPRAWILWLLWVTLSHVVVDSAILGLMLVWARKKGDQRVEQGLRLLLQVAAEQSRKSRLARLLKLPAST